MNKVILRSQEYVVGTSAVRYCTIHNCDIIDFPAKHEYPTIHDELSRSYNEVVYGLKYGSMQGDVPSSLSISDKILGITLAVSSSVIMVLCLCIGSVI